MSILIIVIMFVFSIVGFAIVYFIGVTLFHETSWQVVSVAGISNAGALLIVFFAVIRIKITTQKRMD